jgi:hypothetical protein
MGHPIFGDFKPEDNVAEVEITVIHDQMDGLK